MGTGTFMTPKCLTPECKALSSRQCRGCCMKCWSTAKNMVESGQTTYDELEKLGLIDVLESPFAKALREAREKQ